MWLALIHKQHLLFSRTALEELGVADGVVEVGLQDIGPESSRGLVGHLDAILKNGHWELLDTRQFTHSSVSWHPQGISETRLGY